MINTSIVICIGARREMIYYVKTPIYKLQSKGNTNPESRELLYSHLSLSVGQLCFAFAKYCCTAKTARREFYYILYLEFTGVKIYSQIEFTFTNHTQKTKKSPRDNPEHKMEKQNHGGK